jgi:amino acid adenylation domain-containing protein
MSSDGATGALRGAAALSPAKQALLAKWSLGGSRGIAQITPGDPDAPVALSFVQERQLFLELLDPLTAVNNLATCLRIEGPLDLSALERSANRVIARHETLRTSFDLSQGRAIPRIVPALTFELEVVDLHEHTNSEAEALRVAAQEARRAFHLWRPPLLRAKAFRAGLELHVVVIVVHHTIADGWSLGVLLGELFFHYRALTEGTSSELPPLAIQYRDFVVWQRHPRHGPLFERQLAFWKEQLGGELPVLDLPVDHPRGARQTFGGATRPFRVPPSLTAGLKELGRRHDATLFMTLMAGYQALLHRYCRQDDLLIGTPTAGRTLPETRDLIGPFINTLVLRTDLTGDPSFGELLARVRAVALAAYAHQDLPFERLVAELRPQRDLSRTPIFQAMFNLQSSPLPELEIPGLSVRVLTVDRGAAQFDLTLLVGEAPNGLDAELEYNSDLFDRATIERLTESFLRLLEGAVADPDARLSALPLMSEAERHRLVIQGNDTAADYPRGACVHQLVAGQVERSPDAVAVVCDGARLTYRELDCWANQLATVLRRRGVGPDVRVGVHLERSPALVAALLAVMKAGGAYVPIDPALPTERVHHLLRDSGAAVLLTEEPLHRGGPVDAIFVRPAEGAATRAPDSGVTPANLAYLIYTSGSTGLPKGVLVPHGALANLLWSMGRLFELGPGDRLLAVTSVCFDIAALELYLPLIVGGTVVLATREETLDRRRLHAAITAHRVKALQATPSMWRLILQGDWPGDRGLMALSGGEPLTPELAERLLPRVGSLWNLYGPTETTVWSAACRVRPGAHPITIGRPIANTQLYVLDAQLQPLPVGATGELHIGGDGVALGYHNLPELTAQRFISVPPGLGGPLRGRLFRTGDLARHRPDGTIEVLGRLDEQVKLHGFRIEPGEVESALCRHPAIREAAVVVREASGGEKHLVGYVVLENGPEVLPGELREFLRATLPAYLVPAVFVPLGRLPLTSAGKVDRRSLPAPLLAASDAELAAPGSMVERQLAELYAQVLGLRRVGIHDNFFDLGGGSIQILEIIVRAQSLGLVLSPPAFFEHQTVAALAASVGERGVADLPTAAGHA